MVHQHFEPVWVSVRPVPQVTVDFGNGHTVQRTLHGNIATWVCYSDGRVLDILPGVYTPEIWDAELRRLAKIHQQSITGSDSESAIRQAMHTYHENALRKPHRSTQPSKVAEGTTPGLQFDTVLNQTVRRSKIHRYLRDAPAATPETMTMWLYRDVLKTDLADPYLGLGGILLDQGNLADHR